jgi:putative sigma-54 modulation protein
MQITVTGRHVEVTEPLHSHIEKKLSKICSNDRIIEAHVVLSVERYKQIADITVVGNNVRFHSREGSEDMYASVDKAVEKVERQLLRRASKARQTKRRKSPGAESGLVGSAAEGPVSDDAEVVERYGRYQVSVGDTLPPKPMSVEEAIMQLDIIDDEFYAFVNQQTNDINVVYRKKDGGYGLVRRTP